MNKTLWARLVLAGAALLFVGTGIALTVIVDLLPSDSRAFYLFSSDNRNEFMITSNGTYYVNGDVVNVLEEGDTASVLRNTEEYLKTFGGVLLLCLIAAVPTGVLAYIATYKRQLLLDAKLPNFNKVTNIPNINLQSAPGGIIAMRFWNMDKQGYLKSITQWTKWEALKLTADKKPEVKFSWSGVHAFRLGASYDRNGRVVGIVSLTGHCVGHRDNVIRASTATVLYLVAKSKKDAEILRKHYDCPIVVCSKHTDAIDRWAMSDQGLFWQSHNNKLIRNKRRDGLAETIENLDAYINFTGGDK